MGADDATVDLAEIRRAAADGFVWGAPLVLWDLVRRAHPGTNRFYGFGRDASALAPGLGGVHGDMCSASGILDLAAGPVTLSLPAAHGAVLGLLLHDGWGRIFASLGTREESHARRIDLVGPAWTGHRSPGADRIRAPGDQVWVVSHVLGAGEAGVKTPSVCCAESRSPGPTAPPSAPRRPNRSTSRPCAVSTRRSMS